ncbi:MAG: tRNA 5-methoxyuridine(34)/uridine 5-oxyacetic acid(34) synthase CmoB [Methylovulum sp.]|uniref:tRNA 5-methoxyuridine(34)/uridine 5-oxyacetic acid(34) synthase CmoB n=1 Tax=Methylovulum sp. TaxID=1916980 RepID=UPI00261141C0|nr:tRNA 5-methoxyuridine(34)/uridine 5-oxyacetic acid(34) synthase CmoB [Methylovulum sp.]MDD2724713.1 tRNA 5-methoxyuridine(34)/uridine 5-oxyacetic acid(34) synthase CmoB [Methylovulum sp.]MDD5124662.1 tRNA 5-methoxyuridine(34)/uridine 5-oxyacetic acid(34) synthase CmoB [Methylovulum sp.]
MSDYQALFHDLLEAKADVWGATLTRQLADAFDTSKHGDLAKWQAVIDAIPDFQANHKRLDADAIEIGRTEDLPQQQRQSLEQQLQTLHPWRKGPYQLFGIPIDTEWRSDWKWQRLQDHIAPLSYRRVLDVGCGNGYHCWRMLGAGAKMVIGIDPMLLNVMQFQLIKKLHGTAPIYVLPLGIEDLPRDLQLFDTVFSMGVLYHRRSPIDHLLELKGCLQTGGELVLETLVIDGDLGDTLIPKDRYARMRNVWFLPSCPTLVSWLQRCGFVNVRVVDVTVTSVEEQRGTAWMRFHSLPDFLDPNNLQLTVEGLPAPKRAIVIANNP